MTERRLDHAASLTAHFNAAQRAAESLQPPARRLLDDPHSRLFAGRYTPLLSIAPLARASLRLLDAYLTGLHAHIVLRVRYTDDAWRQTISAGIDQIVLLGAGFDTTSMRMPNTNPALTIFEVDAVNTQREKRRLIEGSQLSNDPRIRWVACDFERDHLPELLHNAGFAPSRRCLVVWLGVTFYLTRTAFKHTLGDLAGLCAPGSVLVVDYGDPAIVTGTHALAGARRTTRAVRRRGEPYRNGFTPADLVTTLATKGFTILDQARVPDLARRYAPSGHAWCSTADWLGIFTAQRMAAASASDQRQTGDALAS